MQEMKLAQPTNDARYRDEARSLRAELTASGIVVPMILFGWLGSALATTLVMQDQAEWWLVGGFAALFVLGLIAGFAHAKGRQNIAMTLVAWGSLSIAIALFVLQRDAAFSIWIAIACFIVILVQGERAGWIAACLSIIAAAFIGFASNNVSLILIVVAPIVALTWLGQNVIGKLMQTVRWMTESYELTRRQAAEMRDQKAELAAALKSLSQSSFSIARANELLQSALKIAEDARRGKQEFAANISHELRAPLNLIIGFSDVLLNAPSAYGVQRVPASILSDVRVIYDSAQHLLKLVDDILDLSQLDVNYMSIAREPIQVEEFIRSSVADFTRLTQLRGLTLTLDIAPHLPEIYADRTRIRQVLFNLLNNALRFTEAGGIIVKAAVDDAHTPADGDLTVASPAVVITVADTGIGIAPKDLPRIFEPFTQVDNSARRKHGGTGLGLTISKRFIELHGGEMWVASQMNQGSQFSFTLPVLPAPIPSAEATTLRTGVRNEIGTLAVIESSPLLARILEHHLAGMRVTHFVSLEQMAALTAQGGAADVEAIIVNAPPNETFETASSLEAMGAAPVFRCFIPNAFERMWPAITSERDPDALRRYLVKPVTRERLYAVLGDMLANTRATEQPARPARLLVVDDDEDTLSLIGRMLRAAPAEARAGYSAILPIGCRSGEQAIEWLHAPDIQFDGVLLDLGLGAVSGFDVLLDIERSERTHALPVCILSGQAVQAKGEPLLSPYIALFKRDGLSASDLTQSLIALLQVALPGVDVRLR